MIVRPLRVAVLALAAWAVLFAPGAAGASTTLPDPDDIAASIVAPTFGPDGLVLGRPNRDVEDLDVDHLDVAMLAVAVVACGIATARRLEQATRACSGVSVRLPSEARAPPLV